MTAVNKFLVRHFYDRVQPDEVRLDYVPQWAQEVETKLYQCDAAYIK